VKGEAKDFFAVQRFMALLLTPPSKMADLDTMEAVMHDTIITISTIATRSSHTSAHGQQLS
jgi:hypothetical protein